MAIKIGGSTTATKIAFTQSDETFSSRLVNYSEGVTIGGVAKTKLYTEVNTNLKVGDRVFIINGNYCNAKLNTEYIYNEYSSGYTILEIDRCAITIDLPLSNLNPSNTADFNDEITFIKTFVVNSSREVDYYHYLMSNTNNESVFSPKFEYDIPAGSIKDIIYNNTGSTITTPNGNVLPNTFYSYVLQSGIWSRYPLSNIQISNELTDKKLYIMEPFELSWSGQLVNCEKTKVYYKDSDGKIQLDITYEDAFISKSNFRFGNFKGGVWNDGIFGKKTDISTEKKTYWEGAKWNNGIFYNSNWLKGRMESKSDKIKQQSYYGSLDEFGLIKQTTDFINNKTFGYNYVFESTIDGATIDNANVFRATFGSFSTTNSIRDEYYLSGTNSSTVTISKGLYYDCDLSYTNINKGTFELSDIINSNITGAKILDTNVNKSIVTDVEYDSFGSVKIIDYDKQYFRLDDYGFKKIGITHKFYLSDADYLKIEEGDSIYFNNIISNHQGVDSLFDKEYYIGLGTNVNTNGFDHGYLDDNHEVIIDLRPKSKNMFKFVLDSGTTSFNVLTEENDKIYNSIDLTFIISSLDPQVSGTYSMPGGVFNNYDYVYNNIILANEDYKSKIVNYANSSIQISKISNSLLDNSTWIRGSREIKQDFVILPDSTPSTAQYPIMSITGSYGAYELSLNLDYSNNRDLWKDEDLDLNEIVYLNNITYNEGTQSYDLSGVYSVSTYSYGISSRVVQLEDYATPILNIGVTYSLVGTYSYRETTFKSGVVNDLSIDNSLIKSGSFRRISFSNSEFSSDTLDTSDELLLKANIKKLEIYRSLLSEEDNLTINKSFITDSILKGATVTDALVYNSVSYDSIFNNGLFYRSYWNSGIFNGGKLHGLASGGNGILTLRELENATEWYSTYLPNTGNAVWSNGEFNGGEFYSSYWIDGTFNNGKFYKSLWESGTFNNGEFGDSNLISADTQFWSGDWYDGVFQKGIFGYRSTTASVTAPYSNWYGGEFRDGIFVGATSSITGEPIGNTIWHDGTFNGGEISGSARWKDGIFNGGKFRSFYGGGTGSSASNYGWEYGTFNNGEFGDTTANSVNTWNSTWYDGIFEGGLFQGRVWNNGIFTGGKFLGMSTNGASSSNNFGGEPALAVAHPENFVLSYSSEVSTNNWYGMWRDGIVIDNLENLTNKSDRRFKEIRRFKGERKPTIIFENSLWVNGTFSSTSGQMRNSVWLNGEFNRGEFIESSFNPYVARWDFSHDGGASQSSNHGIYQHSLTSSCVWNNGTLNNSDFYISSWNNGTFLYGTMSNSEFNNGVSNYMNAYNVIWNNGRWRNGNWYGADNNAYDYFGEFPFASGSTNPGRKWVGKNSGKMDGVIHQMRRHSETSIFFWSLCNTSFEYNYIDTFGGIQVPTNNNYFDANIFVGGLLTSTLILGNATNTDFDNYISYGYDVDGMGIIVEPPGVPTPPYGLTFGVVVDGDFIPAKFGNGSFNKGIWENGVWNNGPRDIFWDSTEEVKLFDAVSYYQLTRDVWQIVLTGSDQNSDITSFTIGDDISIGNIALVDINGDRKLIKDKFKIVNIDNDLNYLYVNTTINFPIRKIEIDSTKHKISVTKNIWLSGLFLNGKFAGIWNNGYFKGYPCITEMLHSNWIDGTLDGGHFLVDVATYSDSLTGTSSFATYSSGVIQNAKIYTNIEDSSNTEPSITNRFDTFIDVNFDNSYLMDNELIRTSSLNYETIGGGSLGSANPYLFGINITYDVLSSVTNTIFRPNVNYNFNLGTKFTEYENILTDTISGFTDIKYPDRLENYGWSFSTDSGGFAKFPGGPVLSATQSVFLASDNDFNKPDVNNGSGYQLNAMNFEPHGADKYYIYHDNQYNINKLRYSRVDIDIEPLYSMTGATAGYIAPFPSYGSALGPSYTDFAYKKQTRFKVSSYFFNRPIDDPLWVAGGTYPNFGLRLDNAKYIEMDMIPFFDFTKFNSDLINCDVRVPYSATAPFIDYADTDFSFIDNVTFTFNEDSVIVSLPAPPVYNPGDDGGTVVSGNITFNTN